MSEPTAAQRRMFAKMKLAMPDGSYYIRNGSVGASDLDNAIKAVGRTTSASGDDAANAVRRHIITRASALKLSDKIPGTWNPDGSLKHDALDDQIKVFFEHFGVKGMHWGSRKSRSGSTNGPVSADSARAHATASTIRKHGVNAVSTNDLQHLVNRQRLEQQHGQLNPEHVNAGKKAAQEILLQVGKQQVSALATAGIKAGSEALIKKYGSK